MSILAGFSESTQNQQFAIVSGDNRLKIWDVLSGELRQQLSDSSHLANEYTCLDIYVKGNNGKVALGTSKGKVIIFDVKKGDMKELGGEGKGHSQSVVDVCFSSHGKTLYSSSEEKTIIEWDLKSGEQSRVLKVPTVANKIVVSPNNDFLLSASSSVHAWDISSLKTTGKWSGHTTPVTCMAITPDSKFFLSGADDRFIQMWAIGESGRRGPVATFAMDSRPVTIQLNKEVDPAGGYHISALSAGGVGYVWVCRTPSTELVSYDEPHCKITMGPVGDEAASGKAGKGKRKGAKDEAAAAAAAVKPEHRILKLSFSDARRVVVARGTVKPLIQALAYMGEDGSLVSQIPLTPFTDGVLLAANAPSSKKRKTGMTATTVDGPRSVVPNSVHSASSSSSSSSPSLPASSLQLDGEESLDAADLKKKIAALPLGERLKAIEAASQGEVGAAPSAGSLHTVLTQALHSKDDALLESCLREGARAGARSNLIRATLQRIPKRALVPLLERVVAKFQAKPSRGVYLTAWVAEALRVAPCYLVSLPGLATALSSLYHTLDHRLVCFPKLLKLSGRLDLLLSQVDRRNTVDVEGEEEKPSSSPVMLEDDGEVKEVEDEEVDEEEGLPVGEDNDDDDDIDLGDSDLE